MKDNKILYIICGVAALVLVGSLLVGLIGGGQTGKLFGDYKGNGAPGETEQTTQETEERTEGTASGNTDTADETTGSSGTDNSGGNQSGNGAEAEDTDIKIPIGAITGTTTTDNDTSGGTVTGSTEVTDNTQNTDHTEATESSGKVPGKEISFDDLLERAEG